LLSQNNGWEISCLPALQYDSNAPLFELNSEYLAETGLPTRKLVLYCRPTFHEQFKFLREKVVEKGVFGWILGPPGTGKSTTALAFASTLDRNEWVITWIHLRRAASPVCMRLEGHVKKCRKFKYDALDEVLPIDIKGMKNFVFLDGYAELKNSDNHGSIQRGCHDWFEENKETRRLVVVCSMSSRFKAKLHEDKLLNIEEFIVYSWKEQEYLDAVKHPDFFRNVKPVLENHEDNSATPPTLEDLVRSKLYFAGASARWMFHFPISEIIDQTVTLTLTLTL
jgi:hypothetical protein